MKLIEKDKNLKLHLVVSGCHLSSFHNYSYKLIEKDNFKILNKIYSFQSKISDHGRSIAVGILVTKLTRIVLKHKPDFIIVVGDREEAIAASIVGNYCKILVIHVAGGDKAYGNADDTIRFATSKLSNIHCVFSAENKKNLINFGEESFRIFNTGNPSLSNIYNTNKISLSKISKNINFRLKK